MEKRTRRLVVLAVLAAILVAPALLEMTKLTWQQWQLDRKLAQLEKKYVELAAQRDRLQNDPVYVEGLIRNTFKQAGKGEYVIPLKPVSSPLEPKTLTSKFSRSR